MINDILKAKKIAIYDNHIKRKTMQQVAAETGCDYIINAGIFDMRTLAPLCHLKVDGRMVADPGWHCDGIGWMAETPVLRMTTDYESCDNYISCINLVKDGKAIDPLSYPSDMGGARPRTAIGQCATGELWLFCSQASLSPRQLQSYALQACCQFAIMLDGGGSTQGKSPKETLYGARTVSNFICVWTEKPADKPKEDKKMKVCLDPGHGTKEMNQSPDGSYIEHEFALDMANRIRAHLIRCGIDVRLTREDSSTPSLGRRAEIANAFGADLTVSLHSNAVPINSRTDPDGNGWADDIDGLTVWTYAAGGERDRAAKLLVEQMEAAGVLLFGSKLYHSKFYILAHTRMPAYLIEYAFHTDPEDVELLKSTTHRAKLAEATAKAICAYGGVKWIGAAAEPAAPPTESGNVIYRVQVGAFPKREAAEKLKNELEGKGYKALVVGG